MSRPVQPHGIFYDDFGLRAKLIVGPLRAKLYYFEI